MSVKYTIPFKSHDDRTWRVDISTVTPTQPVLPDPTFTYDYFATYPDKPNSGNFGLYDNSLLASGVSSPALGSLTLFQGHTYEYRATNVKNTGEYPLYRLQVYKGSTLVYDNTATSQADSTLSYSGIAQPNTAYSAKVTFITVGDPVPATVNIPDNTPVIAPSTPQSSTIAIRGVSEASATLSWDADDTDDPFSTYLASKLTLSIYQQGQINIQELQQGQDKDFMVSVWRDNVLYWSGYLVPEGISYPLLSNPNKITLTAIDGLSMLGNMDYVHNDLPGTNGVISRCPMNYVRNILFNNLGVTLPIRWTNLLECTAFEGEDVMTGSVQWSVNGEGFLSYQSGQDGDEPGPVQKCDYILKGILQAFQCRIYQSDGRWNIRRVNDIQRNSVPYKQIAGDTGILMISGGSENILNQIGRSGYPFINEDALMTTKQGVKSCTVTYNANIRDNILPNGSQDLQFNVDMGPLYWAIYDYFGVSSAGSLDGRDGFSTDVIYHDGGPTEEWFTMYTDTTAILGKNGLPIDTQTMIKYINFGFLFEAVTGFPLVSGGTVIDWSGDPFRIKVIFNDGDIQYFLNKFGFWVTTDTYIPISIDNLQINDVAKVDFNAFQNVIIPVPLTPPVAGSQSDIQILFRVVEGMFYKLDNIYINIDKGNDVYSSAYDSSRNTTTDTRELNISSSFGGYMLSNFMTSPFNSDKECFFRDEEVYQGTLTGLCANAIMRYMYKSSQIFNGSINVRNKNWSFDQMYYIDSLGTTRFMPLNASYNIEKCEVNNLVAIEGRNDAITLTEKYYNSNDNQLSN